MRGFHQTHALCLMTLSADFSLCADLTHRVLRRVHLVTVGATDIRCCMIAGAPVVSRIALVTGQAHRVLPGYRHLSFGTEINNTGRLPALCFGMSATGTVASLTLQSPVSERPAHIVGLRVLRAEKRKYLRVAVATQTSVGTLRAVGRRRRGLIMRDSAHVSCCAVPCLEQGKQCQREPHETMAGHPITPR
jgi:hypothetical protein